MSTQVLAVHEEKRFTDLIRESKSSSKTLKMKRLLNSLQWRHKYQNADNYPIEMLDGGVIGVRQLPNGEVNGLGTGVSVWPAAHILSKYIEKRFRTSTLNQKRVCDIGSGTGCTGFVAAAMGASVTLTDQLQILPFLERNKSTVCQANKHIKDYQIKICRYDWGDSAHHLNGPFDIILISDCVLPKLYPILPLIDAVAAVMGPHSIALFSYEHRIYPYYDPRQEFQRLAKSRGLSVRIIPLAEHDSYYCLDDVEIWEVSQQQSFVDGVITSEIPTITRVDSSILLMPDPLIIENRLRVCIDSPTSTAVMNSVSCSPTSFKSRVGENDMLPWRPVPAATAKQLQEVQASENLEDSPICDHSAVQSKVLSSVEFDERVTVLSRLSAAGLTSATSINQISAYSGNKSDLTRRTAHIAGAVSEVISDGTALTSPRVWHSTDPGPRGRDRDLETLSDTLAHSDVGDEERFEELSELALGCLDLVPSSPSPCLCLCPWPYAFVPIEPMLHVHLGLPGHPAVKINGTEARTASDDEQLSEPSPTPSSQSGDV